MPARGHWIQPVIDDEIATCRPQPVAQGATVAASKEIAALVAVVILGCGQLARRRHASHRGDIAVEPAADIKISATGSEAVIALKSEPTTADRPSSSSSLSTSGPITAVLANALFGLIPTRHFEASHKFFIGKRPDSAAIAPVCCAEPSTNFDFSRYFPTTFPVNGKPGVGTGSIRTASRANGSCYAGRGLADAPPRFSRARRRTTSTIAASATVIAHRPNRPGV